MSVPAGRMPALPGRRRPRAELHAQSGSGLAGHGLTGLPSHAVAPCATARRAVSPSCPTVRYAGELAQSPRYARRGRAAPTSCARSGSPAPHAPGAWLPGREPAGTTTPRSLSGIGRRSPLPGRIAPRPPGSDRSVSVRPIDAAAASIGQNPTLDTKMLDHKDDVMVFSNGTEVTGRIHRICEVMALADRVHDALAAREPVEPVARAPRDRKRHQSIGDRFRAVALEPPAVRPRVAGARAGEPGTGVLRALVLPQWLCGFGRGDRAALAWLGTGAAPAPPAIMEC